MPPTRRRAPSQAAPLSCHSLHAWLPGEWTTDTCLPTCLATCLPTCLARVPGAARPAAGKAAYTAARPIPPPSIPPRFSSLQGMVLVALALGRLCIPFMPILAACHLGDELGKQALEQLLVIRTEEGLLEGVLVAQRDDLL